MTEEQVDAFYNRLEQRFRAAASWQRPIVPSEGWGLQRLGLNWHDIKWPAGLRWSLVGVAHVFGAPHAGLGELSPWFLKPLRLAFHHSGESPAACAQDGAEGDARAIRLGALAIDLHGSLLDQARRLATARG